MTEIVALVDRTGAVTGRAERSVVRRENLMHAATAVLVRDGAGRIYVHRRSPDKDWAPGPPRRGRRRGADLRRGSGRVRRARARRGAGRRRRRAAPARAVGATRTTTTRCVEHCFETTWDGPVRHADGEVVWGAWMTLAGARPRTSPTRPGRSCRTPGRCWTGWRPTGVARLRGPRAAAMSEDRLRPGRGRRRVAGADLRRHPARPGALARGGGRRPRRSARPRS